MAARPPGAGAGRRSVGLRHGAGLTAGRTVQLTPGRHRLGPEGLEGAGDPLDGSWGGVDRDPGIVIEVAPNGTVWVTPGMRPAAIDGTVVRSRSELTVGAILQTPTDHYTLVERIDRPTVFDGDEPSVVKTALGPPPARRRIDWWILFAVVLAAGLGLAFLDRRALLVAALGAGGLVAALVVGEFALRRERRRHDRREGELRATFLRDLERARHDATRRARVGGRGPGELATIPVPSGRPLTGPAFDGVIHLASGDRSWYPRIVRPADDDWDHRPLLAGLDFLPAVPCPVDLAAGALAIVGERDATLAIARHVALSVLVLDPEARAAYAGADREEWSWLPRRAGDRRLDIIDHDATASPDPFTVFLRPEPFAVPPGCQTVAVVESNGTLTIHRNVRRGARDAASRGLVPHGSTRDHAVRMMGLVADHSTPVEPTQPADAEVIDLRDRPEPRLVLQIAADAMAPVLVDVATEAVEAGRSILLITDDPVDVARHLAAADPVRAVRFADLVEGSRIEHAPSARHLRNLARGTGGSVVVTGSALGSQRGEEHDVADRADARQQHHQSVDADPQTARGW